MMKKEFESAVGFEVCEDVFERINEVYMECEFFTNKEQLYNFYKHYDMNGIERMYKMAIMNKRNEEEIRELQSANEDLEDENFKLKIKIASITDNWKALSDLLGKEIRA